MKTWKKKKMKNENFYFLKKLKKIFEIHFTSIKLETFANTPKEDFDMTVLVSEKTRNIFFQIAKIAFFLYFFKKTWKKTEVGQLQTKKFCGKDLWVVSTSSKNFFFVELVKGIKKFSWNNKKQHQKVLFFKSPIYPLLVCLFLLSLSHEVSRVQP